MDYFAGLDISMDETHICVVDRDGAVVYEGKSASTAEAIADKLSEGPSCHRIVFETGLWPRSCSTGSANWVFLWSA